MEQYCIALVGNPNSGKTTLFNRLTGSHQKVGNWPGVTVERKSGHFTHSEQRFEVVDLPGGHLADKRCGLIVELGASAVKQELQFF